MTRTKFRPVTRCNANQPSCVYAQLTDAGTHVALGSTVFAEIDPIILTVADYNEFIAAIQAGAPATSTIRLRTFADGGAELVSAAGHTIPFDEGEVRQFVSGVTDGAFAVAQLKAAIAA